MKSKQPRKMTLAEENKLRKKIGLPPTKRITRATIRAKWKNQAKALPHELRQDILNMLRAGSTYGDIVELTSVDLDTVLGVEELNTAYIPYLRKETL